MTAAKMWITLQCKSDLHLPLHDGGMSFFSYCSPETVMYSVKGTREVHRDIYCFSIWRGMMIVGIYGEWSQVEDSGES